MSAELGRADQLLMMPPGDAGLEAMLAEVVCEGFWEREIGQDSIRWGGNVLRVFGYPRAEMGETRSWLLEHIHPDDRAAVDRISNEAIDGCADGFRCEFRFRRKNDSWAWVSARSVILRDAGGNATRIFGAMIDVSEAKDTESRLRLFTEQLPARATVTDRELRVVWDAGAAYPGNPSAVGRTVAELFADSPDLERVLDSCHRALAGESCRLEIDNGDAAADLQLAPFRDPAGAITGVVGIAFDITDRKRAERAKWETGQHLRTVLDTLPVGAVVMDKEGNVTLRNPAMQRIWGGHIASGSERWRKSEGYWHDSGARIAPHEWASVRAMSTDETILNELIEIDTFRGERKIIENSAAPIHDANGTVVGAVVVNNDVTGRMRSEEELALRTMQLQTLSRQLIQAQEAERRSLSNELHDDVGQMLFALKLNLERSGRSEPESITLVEGVIERMRHLVQALRPPMLDELGLEAALRWHVEREAARAGLAFELALAPLPERPPQAIEITCFRIAQEALSNVVRHARALAVSVSLDADDAALTLAVRDDGRGFDVVAARSRATAGESQGLLSMQERVALVGGTLEIASEMGKGSEVTARLPIRSEGLSA